MLPYTRISLLVVIISVAKCSVILEGISQEHESHRETKRISLEHEEHREGKGIATNNEASRERKKDKGQRTNLAPILDSLLDIIDLDNIIDFESANCTEGKCMSQKECTNMNGTAGNRCAQRFGVCCTTTDGDSNYENEGGDTTISGDGGPFISPKSRSAVSRQDTTTVTPTTEVTDTTTGTPTTEPTTEVTPTTTVTATIIPAADVVQILFDIHILDLLGPVDGDCGNDSLEITGANPGQEIPILCGHSTNQKMYVDIDNSEGPYTATVKLASDIPADRNWNIDVKLLKKADAVPRRCLQYHTATSGTIKSFNADGEYPIALNDQAYSICFGYVVGYCDVAFTFSFFDLGSLTYPCDTGEYLRIGDDKHCGYYDVPGHSITANATGPIIVNVRTGSDNYDGRMGFSANYVMLGC